jgi:hypothetical protein
MPDNYQDGAAEFIFHAGISDKYDMQRYDKDLGMVKIVELNSASLKAIKIQILQLDQNGRYFQDSMNLIKKIMELLKLSLLTNTKVKRIEFICEARCSTEDPYQIALAKIALDNIFEALNVNTTIIELDFRIQINKVLCNSMPAIADILSNNFYIKNFKIYDLGNEEIRLLARAMCNNNSLIDLTIYGSNLGSKIINIETISLLVDALKGHDKLETLDLHGMHFADPNAYVRKLAEIFQNDKCKIKALNLYGGGICLVESASLKTLQDAIYQSQTIYLRKVDLVMNYTIRKAANLLFSTKEAINEALDTVYNAQATDNLSRCKVKVE